VEDMTRTCFIITISLILGFFFLSNVSFAVVDATKSFKAGIQAYESGNYKKAVRLLENAVKAGLSGRNLKIATDKIAICKIYINDVNRINFLTYTVITKSDDTVVSKALFNADLQILEYELLPEKEYADGKFKIKYLYDIDNSMLLNEYSYVWSRKKSMNLK
jgi:hypothetical protein